MDFQLSNKNLKTKNIVFRSQAKTIWSKPESQAVSWYHRRDDVILAGFIQNFRNSST